MYIDFKIENQIITRTDNNKIVGDSKNYLRARFTFSDEWQGISKTVQFLKLSKVSSYEPLQPYNVYLVNDECIVPWEVLTESGRIRVNVFGGDLITTNSIIFSVTASGLMDGQLPEEPTKGYFQQVLDYLAKDFKGDTGDTGPQGPAGGDITNAGELPYTDTNSNLGDATDVQTALDSAGAQVAAVDAQLAEKANKTQEDWITPTLLNGWENTSSTTPIGYYKDTLGVVHFRGSLKSGVDNTEAFVLPVGYRPSTTIRCAGMTSDTSVGRYDINVYGEVKPHTGSKPYVYAVNVAFRAEG